MRIWRLELNPGEATPPHQHSCDYVYVVIRDGKTETHYSNGTVDAATDAIGDCVRHAAGLPHLLRNVGTTRYVNIVIELLGRANG